MTGYKVTDQNRTNKLFGVYSAPAKIWQNANGTWSHHRDSKREWSNQDACATDLRFNEEWTK